MSDNCKPGNSGAATTNATNTSTNTMDTARFPANLMDNTYNPTVFMAITKKAAYAMDDKNKDHNNLCRTTDTSHSRGHIFGADSYVSNHIISILLGFSIIVVVVLGFVAWYLFKK